MFEEIRVFLSSSEAIGVAVVGMAVAMFKAAKTLTNAVEMHENYFVRKRHKRLKESRSSITTEGPYTRYFDEAIQLETVRIEFGIRVGTLKGLALLKISELGYWDHIQVKHIARFLVITPDHPSPKIEISKIDKLGAWCSLGAGFATVIAGGAIWIALTLDGKSFHAYLAGLILFCAFTLAATIFSSAYRRYKNALSFQEYFVIHPKIFSKPSPPEAPPPRANEENASALVNLVQAHKHAVDVTE